MEELSELIGFLLSDGSVYYDKSKRTHCIQYTNKIKDLRERFKKTFEKCFGRKIFHENKCKNAISVRTFSTRIAKILFELLPTYRTKQFLDNTYPKCKVPNFILLNKKFISSFLRAYASSDGCFYSNNSHPRGVIEIACVHPILRTQISECLDIINIGNRNENRRIVISKKRDVERFFNEVGFLEESVVCNTNSKNFGIGKNELFRRSFLVQT